MSSTPQIKPEPAEEPAAVSTRRRPRTTRTAATLMAEGEAMGWLMGGSLAFCLILIGGLIALVIYFGTSTFRPIPLVKVATHDGRVLMGEITREETYRPTEAQLRELPAEVAERVATTAPRSNSSRRRWHAYLWVAESILACLLLAIWMRVTSRRGIRTAAAIGFVAALGVGIWGVYGIATAPDEEPGFARRYLFRTENFDIAQTHFHWVSELEITPESWTTPEWAVTLERAENGRFYGYPKAYADILYPIVLETRDNRQKTIEEQITEAKNFLKNFTPKNGGEGRLVVLKPYVRKIDAEKSETSDRPAIVTADDAGNVSRVIGVAEVYAGPDAAWKQFDRIHDVVHERYREIQHITKHEIGEVERRNKAARIAVAEAYLEHGTDSEEHLKAQRSYEQLRVEINKERARILAKINSLREENDRFQLLMQTANGTPHLVPAWEIIHGYPANRLSLREKAGVYFARWGEFLTDYPRKANSEGGVLPPLIGTIAMTLIMALAVVPFGVLAALYLREYAKGGPVVSAVRIAINNLAGVPSIVFGVFGFGFFCLGVGAYIDGGPQNIDVEPWNGTKWIIGAGVLAVVACSAFLLGVFSLAGKQGANSRRNRALRTISFTLWLLATATIVVLLIKMPGFNGFYHAEVEVEKNPIFGKGTLIWSSLTLALLTLPVVIVATEEALSAVPNSMREGSYACGAGKWQTIRRIVLPRAMPGIMTGMILAMARGAGEVAPLMLVGVVKVARELPLDTYAPFIHLERGFMHLGFHVYDLGFQSQNSEAAKSMVYTTTLLLIFVIAVLNLFAVWLRGLLRRKFVATHF